MKLPEPPTVGPTGSKVTESSLVARSGDRIAYSNPPIRPTREYVVHGASPDDPNAYFCDECDEWHAVKVRTDEEFAKATREHEKAMAKWNRTNGCVVIKGPTVVECRFKCEDGCTGLATWYADTWAFKTVSFSAEAT